MNLQHRTVEVAAAVLTDNGKVLACQRGYGEWKGYWEFPGGKREYGETAEEALRREIREELDAEIVIDRFLTTVEWDYPAFPLTMHCVLCHLAGGVLELREHTAEIGLERAHLNDVHRLPDDFGVLPIIRAAIQKKSKDSDNNLTINTLNA